MTLYGEDERGGSGGGEDELQLVGRVIGDTFRLRDCIASGASGTVYRADQIALGRTVAVKILRPELALDPRFVSRFHSEALAASRLNHPNTVAVIDYGQTEDGLLYLAMEHLRGLTLTEVARAERPLEIPRVVDFVSQIAAGIEEAHEAGVVHADLKPDNVVVEHRRGGWDFVKVVDFGIARLLGASTDDREHAICGTPEYMAPEVVRGGDPIYASDVYALGAILFELLAGRPPFGGETTVEILTAHLQDAPPALTDFGAPALSAGLEEVVLRALEKRPEDRFPGAGAFRHALLRAAGGGREEHRVLCPACGVLNAARFKYCPECGRPRAPDDEARAARGADASLGGARERASSSPPGEDDALFPLPFAGRELALANVRSFARVDAGCLVVAGPPGSGKSRLVRRAYTHPRPSGDDLRVYVATPDPSGAAAPYYPVRSLVAACLDLPPLCTYDDLEAAALDLGLVMRDLPGLTELLAPRGELAELEPASRRRELLASARRAMTAAAGRARVLFVFEDADRYDEPSRALVCDLMSRARAAGLRIAATVTSPPDAPESGIDAIRGRAEPARVDLAPFDEGSAAEIADHIRARSGAELPSARDLLAESEGSPAYLNELCRLVVEGGSPSGRGRSAADLLAARLELLPRPALLVAQAVAAYGLEASQEAVSAALGGRLDEAESEQGVAVLRARGFISAGEMLRFERTFIRDVVYDRTPAERRRELHAACLEHADAAASAGARAIHREGAGWRSGAAQSYEEAGDEAARELDDRGAARHYQRALACARQAMLSEVDDPHARRFIAISIKLADALARTGELVLARGVLDEALGHCHEEPGLKAELLREIGKVHAEARELAAAEASVRQAVGLGIMAGDRERLTRLYLDLANYRAKAAKLAEATAELEEALDLITAGEGRRAANPPPSLWRLALRLGKLYAERGDRERALAAAKAAEALAQRAGSPLGIGRSQAMIAAQCDALGDADAADHYRRSAAEQMRALGDRRGTVEIILSGTRPTGDHLRRDPRALSAAEELAGEIGWEEGAERARRASTAHR